MSTGRPGDSDPPGQWQRSHLQQCWKASLRAQEESLPRSLKSQRTPYKKLQDGLALAVNKVATHDFGEFLY